jgi:hypothetical protein
VTFEVLMVGKCYLYEFTVLHNPEQALEACENEYIPPGGGTTWSRSLGLVLFQIFLMTALSSAFASSIFPSVLIRKDVRTTANNVALNRTVPSLFKGIFIDTNLCNDHSHFVVNFNHYLDLNQYVSFSENTYDTSKCSEKSTIASKPKVHA